MLLACFYKMMILSDVKVLLSANRIKSTKTFIELLNNNHYMIL
jgi:hypothetical protein